MATATAFSSQLFINATLACSLPAIGTTLGILAGFLNVGGQEVRSYFHHLAGGFVFSAVACELLPKLIDPDSASFWPMSLGFLAGIAIMYTSQRIKEHSSETYMLFGMDDSLISSRYSPSTTVDTTYMSDSSTSTRRDEIRIADETTSLTMGALTETDKMVASAHLHSHSHDCFLDGVLVAIALKVSWQASVVMALALALNLLFTALELCAAVRYLRVTPLTIATATLIQVLSVYMGGLGCTLGLSYVDEGSWIYVCMLSCGAAALLFITVEGLSYSNDSTSGVQHTHQTTCFFIGFLIVLQIERIAFAPL